MIRMTKTPMRVLLIERSFLEIGSKENISPFLYLASILNLVDSKLQFASIGPNSVKIVSFES